MIIRERDIMYRPRSFHCYNITRGSHFLINIGEFVEGAFKRVRISYKKRVKEVNIFFTYNYTKARYIEGEYIHIYIYLI